jgi:hypothetical protein
MMSELQKQHEEKSTLWNKRAKVCPKALPGYSPYHQWIPISKVKTPTSEIVTVLMCGVCFHEVNISDAYKHRDCFKD